tara:strand:+ start:21064 stop:21990 length:927 start_codon:yes stop_codon:yes gene_type:complete
MAALLSDLPSFRADLSWVDIQSKTGWTDDVIIDDYLGIAEQGAFIAEFVDRNTLAIEVNTGNIAENKIAIDANTDLINFNFKYLHGSSSYAIDYDELVGYTSGDYSTESGKEFSAKEDILSPAGAFDSNLWYEVSTVANFEFIKSTRQEVTDNFVLASYGDLRLDANTPISDIAIGVYQTVQFANSEISTPKGVTYNLTNESLAFSFEGIWSSNIIIDLTFDDINVGRALFLRYYNITTATAGTTIYRAGVGRNVDVGGFSITTPLVITDSEVGDEFRLEISGDAIFTTVDFEFNSWFVSHSSEAKFL